MSTLFKVKYWVGPFISWAPPLKRWGPGHATPLPMIDTSQPLILEPLKIEGRTMQPRYALGLASSLAF